MRQEVAEIRGKAMLTLQAKSGSNSTVWFFFSARQSIERLEDWEKLLLTSKRRIVECLNM